MHLLPVETLETHVVFSSTLVAEDNDNIFGLQGSLEYFTLFQNVTLT